MVLTPNISRTVLQPSAVLGRDPKGGSTSAKEYSGAEERVAREAARTELVLFGA